MTVARDSRAFSGPPPDASYHDRQWYWAKSWFGQLAAFHKIEERAGWDFTTDDVIAFLQNRRDVGMPAWKRLMAVRGLKLYQERAFRCSADLEPIITKLQEIEAREKSGGENCRDEGVGGPAGGWMRAAPFETNGATMDTIDDVTHPIDPRENEVLQELRRTIRRVGHAYGTETAYVKQVRKFLTAVDIWTVAELDRINKGMIEGFLGDLAVEEHVAANTQNQAFYAIKFLWERVLGRPLQEVDALRSTKGPRLPSVLSEAEVARVLENVAGASSLVVQLMYGCGMRIKEALRLRYKDIDFNQMRIEVHRSKGGKSRFVPLPKTLAEPLARLLEERQRLHQRDLEAGQGRVWLPDAYEAKSPYAARQLAWQFLFASPKLSKDPRSGHECRHHLHADTVSAALRGAVRAAGIEKYVTAHTLRHCFATHLLQRGTDVRVIQELLGHSDLRTTMIYLHVCAQPECQVVSPLDRLADRSETKAEGQVGEAELSLGQPLPAEGPGAPASDQIPVVEGNGAVVMASATSDAEPTVRDDFTATNLNSGVSSCSVRGMRPSLLRRFANVVGRWCGSGGTGNGADGPNFKAPSG